METIKISLAKPMYSLSDLDINWGECEEKDEVLKLVLNNAGAVSIFPDDTILFRRSGTIESQHRFGTDGVGIVPIKDRIKEIIVEQEVRVISVIDDKTFEVEAPKKAALLCTACKYNDKLKKYVVNCNVEDTIFYQDVEMAQEKGNPIKAVYDGSESGSSVYATNRAIETIGIASSYTKYTKASTEDCGGNQEVPYDYFFIPVREARTVFLCDKEISANTVVSFNQNDFYFTDNNGSCVPWTDDRFSPNGMPQTEISVFKRTNYWNVPIGFVQNTDYIHLYQEERNNMSFVEKIKKSVIPPVINMERVKYAPIIRDEEGEEISIVCGITFNLHFRERDDNWNIVKNRNWCTCNPTAIKDKNFEKSDSLYYLGFNDSDAQYQKMKLKKSFIRLSFYSSNDPLSQSLLYYSTIFLDSGYLFGQFNKKRTELIGKGKIWSPNEAPKYVLSAASENGSDIRIDSQITIHNEFDTTKSSEGFNLYLFADDCEIVDDDKDFRTIYMKVEFNHAGYGKTVPFIVWPNKVGDDDLTIDKYFESVYIPLRIQHINDKYYYYFDVDDKSHPLWPYVQCDKDAKSIIFNLFEPKLKKES